MIQDRQAVPTETELRLPGAERLDLIVTRMQMIDTRQCPEDFRVAYQKYIAAFIEIGPYLKTSAHINAFMESFMAGLTGNPNWEQTGPESEAALARITSAYNEMTIIAVKHGARIPVDQPNSQASR